jgi:hypothetical protein
MDASRSDRTGLAAQDWPVPTPVKAAVTHADGESEEDARCEGSWMGEHLSQGGGAAAATTNSGLTYSTYFQSTTGIIIRAERMHPDLQIDRRPSQTNQTNADQPDQDLPARTYENTTNIRPTTGIIIRHAKHIHHPDLQTDRRPSQTNQTNADQPDQDLPARTYENTTNIRPTTGIIVRHSKHIHHPGLQTDHKPLEHLPTNQTRAYQPEHLIAYAYTNQIEGKICVYQPDRVKIPTHMLCCHKERDTTIQHGHYTDLDPNGFRTGDDWPD